jgi:pyrroline-5-carboxylate reductase
MLRLGFVGTGTIVGAIIDGLQETWGEDCRILVSPRSEEVSRALAERYSNVERAGSNAAVVAGSDVVFLGMRPSQFAEAAKDLPFRADQTVVSLLAGVACAALGEVVAPATRILRCIPLPTIRLRKGPVALYPPDRRIEELFAGLGALIVVDRESDLFAMSTASAMMSSHYETQNTVIGWLLSRGMPDDAAAHYVRSLYSGLAAVGLDAYRRGEAVDPAHHETKGGLNECGRRHLRDAGWFDEIGRALDAIEAHSRELMKG